jgi:uncharacterized membrane protein YtjA (UPF0391 family)
VSVHDAGPVCSKKEAGMLLKWALIAAVIALILWLLGFTGAAAGFAEIAQFLVWAFVIVFVVLLVLHFFRGKKVI